MVSLHVSWVGADQVCDGPATRIGSTWSVPMTLPLSGLRTDGDTQSRVSISTLVVDEYADAMRHGTTFPPIIIFREGETYWLADGFHRVYAARVVGCTTIAADVYAGTRRDAVLYAVGANAKHGLRRTNADKRRAVTMLLDDEIWWQWSDKEIARRCAVSQPFVSKVRRELTTYNGYKSTTSRMCADGRTIQVSNIGHGREPQFDELSRLLPAIRVLLHGSEIADNVAELHALSRLAPEQQEVVAHQLLSGNARTVRDAVRQLLYAEKRTVTLQEVLTGQFPTILADPPWQYANSQFNGAAEAHYPTMNTEALCAMPLANYTTSNAVLFLWATNPLLKDALAVMDAWGFSYRTNLVWVKDRATYGKLGFYCYGQHELLLIGVRGSCLPKDGCLPESVLTAAKGAHSAKPEAVYDLIERMYDGPYLELFARQARPGWTSYGNEVRECAERYQAGMPAEGDGADLLFLSDDDVAGLRVLFGEDAPRSGTD